MNNSRFYSQMCIGLFGVGASVLMFWITTHGPGVSPDSIVYIRTAKSLLAGNGFYADGKPMIHFPPVYPLLLSLAGFALGDVFQASRFLHTFLFGANVCLVGLAVYILAERSLSAITCAILLFLLSVTTLSVHSMAWSESPFCLFSLAGFLLLTIHISRPALPLLMLACLFVGLALATRYVGVTLLPPLVLGLVLLGNRPLKDRMRDAIIATPLVCAPLAIWLSRNLLTAESMTNRSFSLHPVGLTEVKSLIHAIYDIVLPISVSSWVKALHLLFAAVLLIVGFVILCNHKSQRGATKHAAVIFASLTALFCIIYIIFLLVSVSLFDAATPLDRRTVWPVSIFLIVAGVSLSWSISTILQNPVIWFAFVSFACFSLIVNGDRTLLFAMEMHSNGIGYTSRSWRTSESIAFVRSLDGDARIYSNGSDVIEFLTGRQAIRIPIKVDAITLKQNDRYTEDLQALCRECTENGAIVVYLTAISRRWNLPTEDELKSVCTIQASHRLADGTIYSGQLREGAEQEGGHRR